MRYQLSARYTAFCKQCQRNSKSSSKYTLKIDKRPNGLDDEFAANEIIMVDVEQQEHVHPAKSSEACTSASQVSLPLIIAPFHTKYAFRSKTIQVTQALRGEIFDYFLILD